jgi:hypothetical protein
VYINISIAHAATLGQSVGIEFDDAGFGGRELNGLPYGIINNVREFSRCKLGPM